MCLFVSWKKISEKELFFRPRKVYAPLNENPHFSMHILVAYLESFSKHYNKTFFIKYFLSYKGLKLAIFWHKM